MLVPFLCTRASAARAVRACAVERGVKFFASAAQRRASSSTAAPSSSSVATSAALRDGGRLLDLGFPTETARFHGVWLRDHCRCPSCTHPVTLQRMRAADDLPSPTLAGERVRVVDGGRRVVVTWKEGEGEGGHESVFEAGWLRRHAYWPVGKEGGGAGGGPPSPAPAALRPKARSPASAPSSSSFGAGEYDPVLDTRARRVWRADDGSLPPLPSLSFPSPSFLAADAALLAALRTLRDVGFFLVTDVEPTISATEAVCRRIGFLRETLYGPGMWTTHVAPDPARITDTAFTAAALPPHTDGNYFQDPPGIQVFHAVVADRSGGGDSVLIDGFAVGEDMRATAPSSFSFLARCRLPYHHTDPDAVVRARRPVFVCDDDDENSGDGSGGSGGTLRAFHFNNDDRDVLSLAHLPNPAEAGPYGTAAALSRAGHHAAAAAAVPLFYSHLHVLRSRLADPRFQLWHGLRPGTVLVFDNTRVLHGRAAFPVTSGRTLAGTYIGKEEWESKLRVLHKRLGGGEE